MAHAVRYAADLLNGVPSIVIGIFVYTLVVLPMKHFSTLAGGLALGIIMIPIMTRSSEEFLRAVPAVAARGVAGARRHRARRRSSASSCRPRPAGIVTAAMLGLARVAGETAPLLFTRSATPSGAPACSRRPPRCPVMIYNYAVSPYEDWHRQAWAAGLVLLSARARRQPRGPDAARAAAGAA